VKGALRERAQDPGTDEMLAALITVNSRLQASSWSLQAHTYALLARLEETARATGTLDEDVIAEVYCLQSRYEEGRRAVQENSAAIEQALGHLAFSRADRRQWYEEGIAEGERRERARRGKGRRTGGRAALRVVPVAAVLGGGWTFIRSVSAARKAAAALTAAHQPAVTAMLVRHLGRAVRVGTLGAAVSATTLTLVVQTAPHTTAIPPRPAGAPSSDPAVPAAGTAAIPAHAHHERHRLHPAAVPPPAPRRPRHPSLSAPPSPAPPGSLTAPAVVITAGGTGILTLTAAGGPVAWTLTCSAGITLSTYSGQLAEGASVMITVTAAGPDVNGTIWLPGGWPVRVRPFGLAPG